MHTEDALSNGITSCLLRRTRRPGTTPQMNIIVSETKLQSIETVCRVGEYIDRETLVNLRQTRDLGPTAVRAPPLPITTPPPHHPFSWLGSA
ncbi:hypothetical protein J6590_026984 [Homalodisca vitripennis]|nr:hypothetical protein J6590_026984 [Homalodisca vitripennis]